MQNISEKELEANLLEGYSLKSRANIHWRYYSRKYIAISLILVLESITINAQIWRKIGNKIIWKRVKNKIWGWLGMKISV